MHLPACQSLSLWERCLRSRRRGQARHERAAAQRRAGSLSERYYRCVRAVCQHPCPLRRSAPAPPKGEPLAERKTLNWKGKLCGLPRPPLARGGGSASALTERLSPAAAHGQASLRTTSQSRRKLLDSSPSRGASGETVHFAGTAKASPTRGGGSASALTERLYEDGPALGSSLANLPHLANLPSGISPQNAKPPRSCDLPGGFFLRESPQNLREWPLQLRRGRVIMEVSKTPKKKEESP